MNKLRLLTIFAVVMLLINIGLIAFVLSKKKDGRQGGKQRNPVELFSRELGFNEAQKAKLEILVKGHIAYIEANKEQAEPIKRALRKNIMAANTASNTDTLLSQLSNLQLNVEQKFHQHFIDIKNLCEGEQINKFEQLLENMPSGGQAEPQPREGKHPLKGNH